ncbi:uncharacterized protein LOC108628452 [Ceratina calcarata]|uniref:Uncharacterized protein LOC108628452 n=1 Tax=Ceratina calcarata TaxID=156304 RepID=A0AAJ7NAJ5_9HYME|nr:uncharacterized protein LOC108628452 [Ceratina calcarata]
MWTALLVLCVVASFDVNARELHDASALELSGSPVASLRTVENVPARVPKRFRPNSQFRRLHIENQHGFDGKVDKIRVNEQIPKYKSYTTTKSDQLNDSQAEMQLQNTTPRQNAMRVARSVEAYGKSKEHLVVNGQIESGNPPVHESKPQPQRAEGSVIRVYRSIDAKVEPKEHESIKGQETDLEGQDSKVFRPLFTYRKQMARKYRTRNHIGNRGFPVRPKPRRNRLIPVF